MGVRTLAPAAAACLVALAGASGAAAAPKPTTLAISGTIVSISADGARVATDVSSRSGTRVCNAVSVWKPPAKRPTAIAKPECKAASSSDENVSGLTLAGSRVVWADYAFGNNAYCSAMRTATLAHRTAADLGICDGTEGGTLYDFAGNGSLLVTRRYTQCDANCAPDYNDTYQTDVVLYRVAATLSKIGPLKRDTHLLDVDGGRLLLGRAKTLEVVRPGHGKSALFFTLRTTVTRAFLSGGRVAVASSAGVTSYDATSGAAGTSRRLPAKAELDGFHKGIALYRAGKALHVLRLSNGRDRTVATVKGLAAARLTSSGLFWAAKVSGGRSRLSFVPFAALTRLLGG